MAFNPQLPIPGVPGVPPGLPPLPTGEVLGLIPPVESCIARIDLRINGMKSGVLGKTRQSQKVEVGINFCRPEFEHAFTEITVRLSLNVDSPNVDVILTPSSGWNETIMIPFVDNESIWLPKSTYTYKAKIIDYKLIAGASIPGVGATTGVPQLPSLPSVPESPEIQQGVEPISPPEIPQQPQPPQLQPPPSFETSPPSPPSIPGTAEEAYELLKGTLTKIDETINPLLENLPTLVPSSLESIQVNETQFPPTLITGIIKPQPTRIDVSAPTRYVDEGATIHLLITAPEETTIDSRVNGTIVFKYTDNTGNIKTTNVDTNGVSETEIQGEVGRGTFTTKELKYGKHSIDMTFDGYEKIGTKRVETLEVVSSKVSVELIRRPVSMTIDVR